MSIKALLYCTNAKPWLCINSGTFFGSNNPYELAGAREKLSVHLNGTVCFECDIEEVEEIVKQDKGYVSTNETLFNTKSMDSFTLRQRSCLTGEEMANYSPERVLVLSLRPKHLCNIANGLKDIETRRQVVNEIKEMEK